MQLFITYDYELFFGEPTGTVEKCIIEPTNLIRKIANNTGVKMVFFIDTGYLKKLQELKDTHEKVAHEHNLVAQQISDLVAEGHDCQLHIHPHWEDSTHNGDEWVMNTDRYKLDDFSDIEIEKIVTEYQSILQAFTSKPVTTFRAGGWCLQPFNRVEKVFKKCGLTIDSTVFPNGKFTAGNYYYDFTNCPDKSNWRFSNDLIKEDPNGPFTEYPISNYFYKPLFFWRLFALGRLKPSQHKPIGDGYPISSPGLRQKMLTKGMNLSASVDGYFVTKLDKVLKKNQKKGFNEMVIIGHPKACTRFALRRLEKFIKAHQSTHTFSTFADING